jgi:hypothetical protein
VPTKSRPCCLAVRRTDASTAHALGRPQPVTFRTPLARGAEVVMIELRHSRS